jgi:hypothetical protein
LARAGSGCERLTALLCRKDCAALRKGDLLFLARAWGYKSCIWVRKRRADGASRSNASSHAQHAQHAHAQPLPQQQATLLLQAHFGGGAGAGGSGADEAAAAAANDAVLMHHHHHHHHGAADASAYTLMLPPPSSGAGAGAHAVSAAALRDRTLVVEGALAAYVAAHLTPLCVTANNAFQGHNARPLFLAAAAAGRLPRACLAAHAARTLAWRPLALGFAVLVSAQRAAVASRLSSLDAPADAATSASPLALLPRDGVDGDTPAWRALANTPAPAEEEFRTFYTLHSVGNAAVDDIRDAATSDPDDASEAWAAEGHAGHTASLELAAAAGALLAHAKMGPLRGYLHAAGLLLELLSGCCDDSHAALLTREAWLAEADALSLAAAGGGAPAAPQATHAQAQALGAVALPRTPPADGAPSPRGVGAAAAAAAAAVAAVGGAPAAPQLLPAAVAAAMMPMQMQHAPAAAQAAADADAAAGFRQPVASAASAFAAAAGAGARGSPPPQFAAAPPLLQPQAMPAASAGTPPLPGSHFLRLWQSLLYHGVRPGLTAL